MDTSESGRARPRSVSTSEGVGTPDGVRKVKKVKEISQDHGRRSSNDLFFDAVGKVRGRPCLAALKQLTIAYTPSHAGLRPLSRHSFPPPQY